MMDLGLLEQKTEAVRGAVHEILQMYQSNTARHKASQTLKMFGDALDLERSYRERTRDSDTG